MYHLRRRAFNVYHCKKIKFVTEAAAHLDLKNLHAVHGRAVELNCKADFREKFDIVTARAVAPSPKIYGETKNFIRRNGRYIFYKTPAQAAEELPELGKQKNMQWQCGKTFDLPGGAGSRCFIFSCPKSDPPRQK